MRSRSMATQLITLGVVLALVLSACSGGSTTAKRNDPYADLPRYGELPTDAILYPSDYTPEELEKMNSTLRSQGESLVACLRQSGWPVTLEGDFPEYLKQVENFSMKPKWPSDDLAISEDLNIPVPITGSLSNDSTIDDARNLIQSLLKKNIIPTEPEDENQNVGQPPARSFVREITDLAQEQAFMKDEEDCRLKNPIDIESFRPQTSQQIQDVVRKLYDDPQYTELNNSQDSEKCYADEGFDISENQNVLIVAPIREWIRTGIKPNIENVKAYERSWLKVSAVCIWQNFRPMREIEVRYNREAGLY